MSNFRKTLERYFPLPKYLTMQNVGIEISPLAVRFIEILRDKEDFRVGRFGHERLKNVFTIGDETSMKEVRDILAKWKKEHGLNFVEVGLPEEKAYLFRTEIPSGTHEEMRAAIEFNLEENVPINPTEAIFDYRIISQADEDKMAVAVTVLPTDIINTYLSLFEEVGMTPLSFLIEAQALAKAVIKREDRGTYFIINIGEIKTGLFVVSEGSVQFTSTLPLGGQDFTKALMKQFNISKEEADDVKKNQGFGHKQGDGEVFGAIISTASAFKEEIEKIYVYWHTHQERKSDASADQNSPANAKKILLSGKDALMTGFKEYISQSLKLETEIVNVWTNVSTFDNYIPPIPAREALDFGRAIGLALPKID
jgi:type IV pilus assembly protein PilM